MSLRQLAVHACLIALIAIPCTARAQDAKGAPCSDSLYLELRRIPIDSLTPRQYEIFRERDRACTQSQSQAAAAGVTAKPEKAHQGFWWGFDLGVGSAQPDCPQCVSSGETAPPPETESGGVFAARLGGTLNERVLVGGEVVAWGFSERSVIGVLAMMQAYPLRTRPVFIRMGLGIVGDEFISGTAELSSSGPGFSAAAGYDFRIGRTMLSPTFMIVRATAMSAYTVTGLPRPTTDIKPSFAAFTVALHRY